MSLITPPAPINCAAAFSAQLPMFLSGATGITREYYLDTTSTIPSPAQISGATPLPQQVFLLTLNEAAFNAGFINPPSVGWRFLAGDPSASVLGTVVQIGPSGSWKLTGVSYGSRVSSAVGASQRLESLQAVAQNDYELRVLVIPGLHLDTFWLRARNAGTSDLIVPFPQGINQPIMTLRSMSPYKLVNFLALIRPLAGSSLAMAPGYGG